MLVEMKRTELTEDKVTHSVVVGHRPGQRALRQELNTCYRKRVHVNLLSEIAQTRHQLRGLPTQRAIYMGNGSELTGY